MYNLNKHITRIKIKILEIVPLKFDNRSVDSSAKANNRGSTICYVGRL